MRSYTDIYYLFFGFVLLLTKSSAEFLSFNSLQSLCKQVVTLNCATDYSPDGDERVCGNDGVTYSNFCFYAQSRCRNAGFLMRRLGTCDPSNSPDAPIDPSLSSTVYPTQTTTYDIIAQVFCSQTDAHLCPVDLDPVCGSDGQFYRNDCEFALAKCKDTSLTIVILESCKATTANDGSTQDN